MKKPAQGFFIWFFKFTQIGPIKKQGRQRRRERLPAALAVLRGTPPESQPRESSYGVAGLSSPCGKQRHEQRFADQGYHWGKSGNSPAASAVEDHHVDLVSHKTLATKPSSGEKKRVICSFSTNTTRWDSPTTQARPLSNWYSKTFFPPTCMNINDHLYLFF